MAIGANFFVAFRPVLPSIIMMKKAVVTNSVMNTDTIE